MQLTHRNLWLNATTFGWHLGVDDRDVYLHTLPQFHCNGWGMLYAVTGMGAPHVVLRKVDGAEILRRVDAHGVTLMCGAPAVLNMVLDAAATWEGPIPGAGRTRIVVAGAPPPTRTIERIESELGWEFVQIYGLTETSPAADDQPRPRRVRRRSTPPGGPTGCAAPAVRRIGCQIGIGDDGEVLARSNVVMEGYWEQPEATAAAIVDGWFHTGDGGEIDEDQLRDDLRPQEGRDHLGRRERLVDRGRGRHLPAPRRRRGGGDRHPRREVGRAGDRAGVTTDGSALAEDDVIAWTKQRLAGYKCPKRVEFRSALARTATGKLQKFKLREPFWVGRDRQVN